MPQGGCSGPSHPRISLCTLLHGHAHIHSAVCIHTRNYTRSHRHTYTQPFAHIHAAVRICSYTRTYAQIHAIIGVHTSTHTQPYAHIQADMHASHTHTCRHTYAVIRTHTHTYTQPYTNIQLHMHAALRKPTSNAMRTHTRRYIGGHMHILFADDTNVFCSHSSLLEL